MVVEEEEVAAEAAVVVLDLFFVLVFPRLPGPGMLLNDEN